LTTRPKEIPVSCHIGIDGGGTKFAVAAFRSQGDPVPFHDTRFDTQKVDAEASDEEKERAYFIDGDNLIQAILEVAVGHEILSISMAVAGNVSDDRTHIVKAGTIVHWERRNIFSLVAEVFGCPVYLGGDGEALVLAEMFYGRAGYKPTLGMIWGTGVGGAFSKFTRRGLEVFATELGHMDTEHHSGNTKPCGCGSFSCLESHIGGKNIEARHGNALNVLPTQWNSYYSKFAWGIEATAMVAKPELVVLGGGAAWKQREMLVPFIEQYLSGLTIVGRPEVVVSSFGESAGTVGALALGRLLTNGEPVPAGR